MREDLRRRLRSPGALILLLVVFVVAGALRFRNESGEDLASSYVGCRLMATGHADVLFAHDTDNFADVGDRTGTWDRLGRQGGFYGYLHPYVQTPLWAYLLEPLCDHTRFRLFEHIFLVLTMMALAGTVWLIARFWTPWLYGVFGMGVVLIGLWYSQPFRYAMFLMQTHALFLFLTIAALILAERRWPLSAGFLLACAAAVKVTPGMLLIYWLLTRRWKAAASLVVWSVVLMGATYLAVGSQLMHEYFATLHRVSRVLLVAQNNQSFAAWVMARFYAPDEVFDISILRLPASVRIGSMLLMLGCIAVGGWLDRWRDGPRRVGEAKRAPIGAMIALVAMTVFAPIAWTHYFILLVAPVMVLAQESRNFRSWWMAAVIAVIVVLSYPPLATDVIKMDISDASIVRGQFFAGVLCMAALGWAGWMSRRRMTAEVSTSVAPSRMRAA